MPAQSLEQLKAAFRGDLIQPTDPDYEFARKLYNGMINSIRASSRDASMSRTSLRQ